MAAPGNTSARSRSTAPYRPLFLDRSGDLRPSVERELNSISNALTGTQNEIDNRYTKKEVDDKITSGVAGVSTFAGRGGAVVPVVGDYSAFYELKGSGGGSYTLPAATASVRGGIRVGSGLTITGDVLSATGGGTPVDAYTKTESDAKYETKTDATTALALKADKTTTYTKTETDAAITAAVPAPYTLPVATASVLGGVKQGTNITIAADGTISSTASGGGGGDVTAAGNNIFTGLNEFQNITHIPTDPQKGIRDKVNDYNIIAASTGGIVQIGNIHAPTIINSSELQLGSKPITGVADPTNAQDAATKAYVDANSSDVTLAGDNAFTGINTVRNVDYSTANASQIANIGSAFKLLGDYIGLHYLVDATNIYDFSDTARYVETGLFGGVGQYFTNTPPAVSVDATDECQLMCTNFGTKIVQTFLNTVKGRVVTRTVDFTDNTATAWVLIGDGQGSGGGVTVPDTFTDMDTNTATGWFRTSLTTGTGVTASLKAIVPSANGDEAIVNHIQHADFAYQTAYIGGPGATNAAVGTYYYFRVKPDSNPWVAWQKMSSSGAITSINVGAHDFPITADSVTIDNTAGTGSILKAHDTRVTGNGTKPGVLRLGGIDATSELNIGIHDTVPGEVIVNRSTGVTGWNWNQTNLTGIQNFDANNGTYRFREGSDVTHVRQLDAANNPNGLNGGTFRSNLQNNGYGAVRAGMGFYVSVGTDAVRNGVLFVETDNGTGGKQWVFRQSDGVFTSPGQVVANGIILTSDRDEKENITKIETPLDKIDKISGYTYNMKHDGRESGGVIAQEVQEILPGLVHENPTDQHLMLDYQGVIGLLVESVKELKAQVESLQSQLNKEI